MFGINEVKIPASQIKTDGRHFPPYTFTPATTAGNQTVGTIKERIEKSNLIEVDIQELKGVYLIVNHPTGVDYTIQCGGLGCLHPSLEGFLLPLTESYKAEEALAQHFIAGHSYSGPEEIELQDIEDIFKKHQLDWLSIDRDRLKESVETWIYVKICKPYPVVPFCYGSDPKAEMVLIWQNSD